jgi:hypothetical protein
VRRARTPATDCRTPRRPSRPMDAAASQRTSPSGSCRTVNRTDTCEHRSERVVASIHGWDTWDIILGTHSSDYLLSSNVVCCRVHQAGKADRSKSMTKLAGAALVRNVVQTMGAVHLPGRHKQMHTSNWVHYETNHEVCLQPRVFRRTHAPGQHTPPLRTPVAGTWPPGLGRTP